MDAGRGSGMGGPEPLRPADVAAWAQLSGVRLRPWEFAAIQVMDRERCHRGRPDDQAAGVSMKDGAGVRSLMRGLGVETVHVRVSKGSAAGA